MLKQWLAWWNSPLGCSSRCATCARAPPPIPASRPSTKPYASLTGMEGMWRKCGEKEHFGLDCPHFGRRDPTGAANLARKGYTSTVCAAAPTPLTVRAHVMS